MNRYLLLPALVAGLVAMADFAQAQDRPSKKFLTEAIEGNYAEVQMGQLAQKNGNTDEVKSFGKMLETDHDAANQKATQVAQSLAISPPSGPNKKQKADYEKLAKMDGAAFDKMFAEHMIKDHKKDISEYRKAAKIRGAAGEYASNTLPTLQKHLDTAQSIQKQQRNTR
jgi:predicted outer membrane protein